MDSMHWLAVHIQSTGQEQIETGGDEFISAQPYRVINLRNEQGLVSLEPYPLLGGTVGLITWEGKTRKQMWPLPKTEEELLEFLYDPNAKRLLQPKIKFIEESAFLSDHCWNCRKKVDNLMKCGNCRDVKYCSKACQKENWRDGHKFECEGRKQALKVRTNHKEAGREFERAVKEELLETVLKNKEYEV